MQRDFPCILPTIRFIPSQFERSFVGNESAHIILGYNVSPLSSGIYKELATFDVCCIYSSDYGSNEFRRIRNLTMKDLHGRILMPHPLTVPLPIRKMQAVLLSAQDGGNALDTQFHYCDSYSIIKLWFGLIGA